MINTERDDKQFRRGVVLGLTMAEILLLLIFLLMLLLISQLDTNTRELTTAQDRVREQDQTIIALRDKLAVILGPDSEEYNGLEDYIHVKKELAAKIEELEQANLTISQSGEGVVVVEKAKDLYPDIPPEEAVQKMLDAAIVGKSIMETNKDAGTLLAEAASCQIELDRCTGQVAYQNTVINNVKGGSDKPPCWADKVTGKIQYIFGMTITDDGIVVTDRKVQGREKEQASLPIQNIVFDTPRKVGQFVSEVDAIYKWSVKNECRFHVPIANKTNSDTKAVNYMPIYKTIKDRFYSPN